MFELTNEQRKCFGLLPVEYGWTLRELKGNSYDDFRTFVYVDGNIIRKCVLSGENRFAEYELSEHLSEDGKYLLPKTAKGKPMLLSSATLLKRNGFGMCLAYGRGCIDLTNRTSLCTYYTSVYDRIDVNSIESFSRWVTQWCEETTPTMYRKLPNLLSKEEDV